MDDAPYVNVFRDTEGNTHYSTEEFSVNQSRIVNLADALEDAYRFAVLGNWKYVCTLARHGTITEDMRRNLDTLENARFIVESYGKEAAGYRADELAEEAETLCANATLAELVCE